MHSESVLTGTQKLVAPRMLDQEGENLFGCRIIVSLALYISVKGLEPEYFVNSVTSDNF